MRRFLFLPALLLLGMAVACGGGSSSPRPPAPTGTLTLRMGTDSFPGYDQVVVSLDKVEASGDGSTWIPLGDVHQTFDLMALQNGHSLVILPTKQMNLGSFSQFRLTWASTNYQDHGSYPALVVPSGGGREQLNMPASTIVSGSVSIAASAETVAQIMFSGQDAVQSHPGPFFQFQANGHVFDMAATAHINGQLADNIGPLPYVEVFAEYLDGDLNAYIQRRAFTDATGHYTLEALPTGSLYFVVAQPAGSLTSYAAVSSAAIDANTASAFTANLSFASPQIPGSLTLNINPYSLSNQTTWGELRQNLSVGPSISQKLIVRSETVLSSPAQDQVTFLGLYPGLYGVAAQRSTSGGAPVKRPGPDAINISSGAPATAFISYP